MQNKYVGDIGDFGKYGLLRELFGRPEEPGSGCGLRLAVAWYLNEGERYGLDGRFTDYLCKSSAKGENLRKGDPVLYNILRRLVKSGNRKVAEVEKNRILPGDTLYHRDTLCSSMRTKWFKGALEATKEAAVVFVDPDNGIASEKTPAESPKHVSPYELDSFFKRGQSLVIYHHLTRQGKAPEQISRLEKMLVDSLKPRHALWALRYRRGSGRVYLIVAQEWHKIDLERRLQEFQKKSCWFKRQPDFPNPHFKLV